MEKKIWNLVILDASGSMSSMHKEAAMGVQETIMNIRNSQTCNKDIKQYLTLLLFSGADELIYRDKNKPIEEVNDFTPADYKLLGCTALYDAIGTGICDLRGYVGENDNVLVTIVTDGYENSSRSFTQSQVKDLIEACKKKDWVFTFIGTDDIDVNKISISIGIKNTLKFERSKEGMNKMWEKERRCRAKWNESVKSGRMKTDDYFDEENENDAPINRITSEHIDHLKSNEVFVFGSDISGKHSGGAAYAAVRKFGAIPGQAEGPQGQCYAIPTTGIGLREIKIAVDRFIEYAKRHPNKKFLVTRFGCGRAGWTESDIAPFLYEAKYIDNISLCPTFWNIIQQMS